MRLVVALSIAACSSPPSPSVPSQPGGRAERLQLGRLEAYALEDGYLEFPNDAQLLGVGRTPAEIGDVLAAAGLSRDTIRLDVQCLLVKADGRVMLFDTGLAEHAPTTGRLHQSLVRAGVAAAAVTDIFISHAHSDHVAGLITKAGALAFPAATIHLSAPEWAALQADTEATSKQLVAAIAAKVSAFEPGAQVVPGVQAVASAGHTPGHSAYVIGGGELFYLGDLAHHSIISVQRPAWAIAADGDRPVAEAVRQHTLGKLAADGVRVFSPHFPFPGIGRVVVDGAGFAWRRD